MTVVSTADTSTLCKITNGLSSAIAIALPISQIETPSAGSKLSINRDIEVLPVNGGQFTIEAGSSGTVTLKRSYLTDAGTQSTERAYDLLICKAGWLSPVTSIGVSQKWDDYDNRYFEDQTIAPESDTAVQQTVNFYQTISAYPDSQLTKDYVNAMSGIATDAGNNADLDAGDLDDQTAAFFSATKNFQQVSVSSIIMLEQYYNAFLFAWAQYQDQSEYYLYTSDGQKTKFQGKVQIKKSGDIDITLENGGYACTFVPAVAPDDTTKTDVDAARSIPLTYVDGLFVDDQNADVPQISLKGLFQLKRTFTRVSTDTDVMPVLSGSIYGTVALGFNADQATAADDNTLDWLNSLFNPTTAQGIFSSVMQILNALMLMHFAGGLILGIGRWLREKISGKTPVKLEDIQQELNALKTVNRSAVEQVCKKIDPNSVNDLPLDSVDASVKGGAAQNLLDGQVGKVRLSTNIVKTNKGLANLETFAGTNEEFNQRIGDAYLDLRAVHETLFSTEPDELKTTINGDLMLKMKTLSENVSLLSSDIVVWVEQGQQATAQKNDQNIQDTESSVTDQEKSAEEQEAAEKSPDVEVEAKGFPKE